MKPQRYEDIDTLVGFRHKKNDLILFDSIYTSDVTCQSKMWAHAPMAELEVQTQAGDGGVLVASI